MTADRTDPPLVLAVPSKGRLQENASAFFARAGLSLVQARGERDYRGAVAGVPDIEVLYLSASEIARELASGGAHLGVTGEDLIRENIADASERLELVTPLGFGHADVVVAVPQAWIDVRRMADLEDVAAAFRMRHGRKMRVATKYVNLTRRFFAHHGIADYRIVESLGATEGAPASGAAELIVDITTTGSTLAANALKIISDGVMLKSQANLVASLTADWGPRARGAVRTILSRIAAEEEARTTREVRARFARRPAGLADEAEAAFGAGVVDVPEGTRDITLQVSKDRVFALSDWLVAKGAERVAVAQVDYVFRPANAFLGRLEARIG